MLNNCTMSIVSTDFCIPHTGAEEMGNIIGLHKYKGKSALQYKLGVDILAGNLVWIEWQYPAGALLWERGE